MLLTKCVQLCTMPVHLPGILILYTTNTLLPHSDLQGGVFLEEVSRSRK